MQISANYSDHFPCQWVHYAICHIRTRGSGYLLEHILSMALAVVCKRNKFWCHTHTHTHTHKYEINHHTCVLWTWSRLYYMRRNLLNVTMLCFESICYINQKSIWEMSTKSLWFFMFFPCYVIIIYQNMSQFIIYIHVCVFPISYKTTIKIFLLFAINYGWHIGVVYSSINVHWKCYNISFLLFDAFLMLNDDKTLRWSYDSIFFNPHQFSLGEMFWRNNLC